MEAAGSVAMVAMVLLSLAVLWAVRGLGRGGATRLRLSRSKAQQQSRKHFMAAAQLLARSRASGASGSGSARAALAREACRECDKAVAADPREAAAHIVKAVALEQLGRTPAALRSLSAALSPPAVRSLTRLERADALLKRAAMSLGAGGGRRRAAKSAMADAEEAVSLNPLLAPSAQQIIASCCQALDLNPHPHHHS